MIHDFPRASRNRFDDALDTLHQCCADQQAYMSERFSLPHAELRCLLLFGGERYLTAKGITARLNITKSRVSKLLRGLEKKGLVAKIADPADSRVALLALTQDGQNRRRDILSVLDGILTAVLHQIDPSRLRVMLEALEALKSAMVRAGESFV